MPLTHFDIKLTATLAIQVADQIGRAIVEEQLAPGERIREVNLAAAFGTSRATVREALRILEQRGLVRIAPQRGATVTLLSLSELQNLFEIRAALLGLASRRAARCFQPDQADVLRSALGELEQALADADAYVNASAAMIKAILGMSGNEQLSEIIAGFAQRIGRYVRRGLSELHRREQSLLRWRRLVDAIIAKDEAQAEEIHRQLAYENCIASMNLIASQQPLASVRTASSLV